LINCEVRTFSKDLLNNYEDLKVYLSGKVDLDKIKLLVENPATICSLQDEKRGILKTLSQYSIRLLFAPSLSILSKLVYGVGLKRLGSFFKIAKGHLSRDFRSSEWGPRCCARHQFAKNGGFPRLHVPGSSF
jgi:hypothetical protein